MRKIKFLTAIILFCLNCSAQSDSITYRIQIPDSLFMPLAAIYFESNEKKSSQQLSVENRIIYFKLAKKDTKATIKVTLSNIGFSQKQWDKKIQNVFSDKIDLNIINSNAIQVEQWPLCSFESSEMMDIEIDNEGIIGSTSIKKTLKPNIQHTIKWLKGGIAVCNKTITLPPNVERKYSCTNGVVN
jgi:hypothetical protein